MNKFKKILAVALVAVCMTAGAGIFGACGGYCAHVLEEVKSDIPTCVEHHKTVYECTKCHKTFSYTDAKGLYEISDPEPLPLDPHTPRTGAENLSMGLKEGVEEASSFADLVPMSTCAVCGEKFALDMEDVIPYTPSDNLLTPESDTYRAMPAEHFTVEGTNFVATEVTVKKYEPDNFDMKYDQGMVPQYDSGTYIYAQVNRPFERNVHSYTMMAAYNPNDFELTFMYITSYYGERSENVVTVAAKSYATFVVDQCVTKQNSQKRCNHYVSLGTEVDGDVKLQLFGYMYIGDRTLQSISLTRRPKVTYTEGQTFEANGMVVTANFGANYLKLCSPSDFTVDVGDRPLTVEDAQVVISYMGKTINLPITVTPAEDGGDEE